MNHFISFQNNSFRLFNLIFHLKMNFCFLMFIIYFRLRTSKTDQIIYQIRVYLLNNFILIYFYQYSFYNIHYLSNSFSLHCFIIPLALLMVYYFILINIFVSLNLIHLRMLALLYVESQTLQVCKQAANFQNQIDLILAFFQTSIFFEFLFFFLQLSTFILYCLLSHLSSLLIFFILLPNIIINLISIT